MKISENNISLMFYLKIQATEFLIIFNQAKCIVCSL